MTIFDVHPRRVLSLTTVRSDGWFDKLRVESSQFDQVCRVVGDKVLAFAIVSGVQVTSIALDRRNVDGSMVGFVVGGERDEHRLPLGELRRRLAHGLAQDEPPRPELGPDPSDQEIQLYIGLRDLYLAPVFGITLLELHEGGDAPPELRADLGQGPELIELDELRQLLHESIRAEATRSNGPGPMSFDLAVIDRAEAAAEAGDHGRVVDLLGSWAGPLSLLLRTADGQQLGKEVRVRLARALGLLGTAHLRGGNRDFAEEVLRLGIQWAQDGEAAGELFRRLGEALVEKERYGEAIGILRRALTLGSGERETLPVLATCFVERGRFVAAAVCAERALAAGASDGRAAAALEAVRAHLGEAWDSFREVVPGGVGPGSAADAAGG